MHCSWGQHYPITHQLSKNLIMIDYVGQLGQHNKIAYRLGKNHIMICYVSLANTIKIAHPLGKNLDTIYLSTPAGLTQ